MYRRLFKILLIVCMFCTVFNTADADSMKASDCYLVTSESLKNLIGEEIKSFSAKYCYEFSNKNNELTLETILTINDKEYIVNSNGSINDYTLKNIDISLYSLEGTVVINGIEYIVFSNASYNKNKDILQIDATIQNASEDAVGIDPVCFSYGEKVLELEMFKYNDDRLEHNKAEYNVQTNVNQNRGFSYVTSQTRSFPGSSGVSGYSQQVRVYKEQSSRRFSIGVISYTNNVRNYYLSQGNPSSVIAYVSDFSIRMRRNTTTNVHTYIAGIETYSFTNFNASGEYLLPLFEDILSAFGIPTSTINDILSNAAGRVTESYYTNDTTVSINNMSAAQSPNMDSVSCGLPIVFQLASSSSGSDSYSAITSIKYGVIYVPNSPTPVSASLYTVSGNNTSVSFSVSF